MSILEQLNNKVIIFFTDADEAILGTILAYDAETMTINTPMAIKPIVYMNKPGFTCVKYNQFAGNTVIFNKNIIASLAEASTSIASLYQQAVEAENKRKHFDDFAKTVHPSLLTETAGEEDTFQTKTEQQISQTFGPNADIFEENSEDESSTVLSLEKKVTELKDLANQYSTIEPSVGSKYNQPTEIDASSIANNIQQATYTAVLQAMKKPKFIN